MLRVRAPSSAKLRRSTFVVLAVVLVVGYWGLAFALGEAYPLSPLGMFSRPETSATRIVVRTQTGTLAEVTSFEGWSCPSPLTLQGVCTPLHYSAQDERVLQYIRENEVGSGAVGSGAVGSGSEDSSARSSGDSSAASQGASPEVPVELVRLIYRLPGAGAPLESEICPIVECRARERRK